MLITNIVTDSFIDYKGEQSLVVFSKGCNLNCDICYNKSTKAQFHGGLDILECLDTYLTKLHTAVVISGGEPTIHEDLPEICKIIKNKYNKKLKIFSNGLRLDMIKKCMPFVDEWSIDFKTLTGDSTVLGSHVPNYSLVILEVLSYLAIQHKPVTIRIWKHDKSTQLDIDIMKSLVESFRLYFNTINCELVDILK